MSHREKAQFRATAGAQQGFGATPQEALNALMSVLPDDVPTPIVIWPYNRGDAFFTDAQQARLQELNSRRNTLTDSEREELERLIEASFEATIARTQTLPLVKS
ncbi:MAG TPA: hypothetical protein VFA07_02100 [Chthonomonadaceae bacterium]|nr:hypothetical protein [Chthonomonadaceae bacterium]